MKGISFSGAAEALPGESGRFAAHPDRARPHCDPLRPRETNFGGPERLADQPHGGVNTQEIRLSRLESGERRPRVKKEQDFDHDRLNMVREVAA
jgi:hypothetical protein